ncbi:hypothetical protein [Pseudactinotalea sp.]|uniref:hypothetical protein n=1 Tax=Pseudactinotalea sp. TaxID=1926260 RepID=UPI003B3AAD48
MASRAVRYRFSVGLAILGALALGGCSDADGGSAEFEEPTSASATDAEGSATPTPESEASESSTASGDDGASAGATSLDPADAVEALTYPMPDGDGEITVGLHSLRVEGQSMVLMLSFVADYEHAEGDELTFNEMHGRVDNAGNTFIAPVLSDRDNLKTYHVLTQKGEAYTYRAVSLSSPWSTDVNGLRLTSGEPLFVWANYALPEEGTEKVTISIDQGLPQFEDVVIER